MTPTLTSTFSNPPLLTYHLVKDTHHGNWEEYEAYVTFYGPNITITCFHIASAGNHVC